MPLLSNVRYQLLNCAFNKGAIEVTRDETRKNLVILEVLGYASVYLAGFHVYTILPGEW